jgi:hypothetical protein
MNYKKPLRVNDIVVVPLAGPNGSYIRLNDGSRVPVLAKVRSLFSETANVINYFGYIYNVPISHVETIMTNVKTHFYVNMVEQAGQILNHLGYDMLDNSEFYATSMLDNNFLTDLPAYNIIPLSPHSPNNIVYQVSNPKSPIKVHLNPHVSEDEYDYNYDYTDHDSVGEIRVMDIHNSGLLHVITNRNKDILFEKEVGELAIKGYGNFLVDRTYVYKKKNFESSYVIFKSQHNYFHIKKKYIDFNKIKLSEMYKEYMPYNVKVMRPKKSNPSDKQYFSIISIINQEFI